MSEILLCTQPFSHKLAHSMCGVDTTSIHGLNRSQPNILSPYTPYALNSTSSVLDEHLLSSLSSQNIARELTNTALSLGEDNTMAIAEILNTLQEQNISAIGASASVYGKRMESFVGAIQNYQQALMEYRTAIETKASTQTQKQAKQKALHAFNNLQYRFRNELSTVNSRVKSRRGTPLSSFSRATNIAQSSRSIAKLNVTSQIEANNLIKFTKHTKYLGGGLAVIDFGNRVGNVQNSYAEGENWERELFIESFSFATSAGVAYATTGIGSFALGFLAVATPVGWVGLIVGGLQGQRVYLQLL